MKQFKGRGASRRGLFSVNRHGRHAFIIFAGPQPLSGLLKAIELAADLLDDLIVEGVEELHLAGPKHLARSPRMPEYRAALEATSAGAVLRVRAVALVCPRLGFGAVVCPRSAHGVRRHHRRALPVDRP